MHSEIRKSTQGAGDNVVASLGQLRELGGRRQQVHQLPNGICIKQGNSVLVIASEVPNYLHDLFPDKLLLGVQQLNYFRDGLQLPDLRLVLVVQRQVRQRPQHVQLHVRVRRGQQRDKLLEAAHLPDRDLVVVIQRKLHDDVGRRLLEALLRRERALPPGQGAHLRHAERRQLVLRRAAELLAIVASAPTARVCRPGTRATSAR
mmetsp:Transcript_1926/g.7340  ORF Transcript_1926/g.7340 Transcript_1926/m.7340 type:complete len:204 (-) Transcript_1926:55-666(-)